MWLPFPLTALYKQAEKNIAANEKRANLIRHPADMFRNCSSPMNLSSSMQ